MRKPTLACLAGLLLLATASLSAHATSGQVYWSDELTNTIQRANFDGSMVVEVIGIDDAEDPGALTIDAVGNQIYWASFATPPFIPKIRRANLDGTNVEDVVIVGGKARPGGVALDLVNGKVLLTDPSDCDRCGFVDRANLDGSGDEHLITGLNFPRAIAVDPAHGFIWWSEDAANGPDGIRRANLDGSDIQLIVSGPYVGGLAVDPGTAKIYWTDENDGSIQRSNLDGTLVEDLVTSGLQGPRGIALDLPAGKMYWTNRIEGTIQRANLDGSFVEDVLSDLPRPTGIGLVPRAGQPVPALSPWGMLAVLLLLLAAWGIVARVRA